MSGKHQHKIFEPTGCLTEQTMYDYIDKKLTPPEEHIVEKHLLDCELCSDAIEGLELIKDRNRVTIIRNTIDSKISETKDTRIIIFNYRTVTAIAASLVLLIGAVFFFKFYASKEAKNADMAILQPNSDQKEELSPLEQTKNLDSNSSLNDLTTVSGGSGTEPYKATKDAELNEESTVEMEDAAGAAVTDETRLSQTITTKGAVDDMEKYYSKNGDLKKSEALKADEKTVVTTTETEGVFSWTSTAENDNENRISNNKNNNNGITTLPQSSVAKDDKAIVVKEENNQVYRKEKEARNDKIKPKKRSITAKQEAPSFEGQKSTPAPESQTQIATGTSADYNQIADSIFIYDLPQTPAQFPGGEKEFINYISKNFNPPLLNKIDQINNTKMFAQFIIDREGNVQDIKITKSVHPSYDSEMIRVLKAMPKWTPAKQNGKAVNSRINYPIQIELK